MGLMRKALEKRSRRICANLYLSLKRKKGQWWQIPKEVRIEMEEEREGNCTKELA